MWSWNSQLIPGCEYSQACQRPGLELEMITANWRHNLKQANKQKQFNKEKWQALHSAEVLYCHKHKKRNKWLDTIATEKSPGT